MATPPLLCRSPCHVVYTDFRPTPLQHYLFPAGADSLYMVVDERSRFREDNFQKAIAALTEGTGDAAANGKGGKGAGSMPRECRVAGGCAALLCRCCQSAASRAERLLLYVCRRGQGK